MKILQNLKNSKGITLVALVVTIVVLLILAGVSLNLVLGENGIIAKARDARDATKNDVQDTQTALNSLYDEMEAAINGGNSGGNSGSGENPGVVEDPYEGKNADDSWEIGLDNPKDVIAYLYLKENGNYDLVVRGTGTGEMMSFGETYAECGAYCTTIFSDYALENVYITSGVTNIGNAMFNNLSLNEVHIANTVTKIGDGVFSYSTISNSIVIPESVEYIGMGAFCCCNTNITLLNENVFLKAGVFNELQGELTNTKIIIKEGTDVLEKYVLYGCNNLKEVVIPNSVTSIGFYAFAYCTSLTSITIPASVTNIGRSAFFGCTSLTNITIPASVTSIPNQAFYNCTSLTDVYYAGSEDDWKAIAIGSYNDPLTNATIHYNSTGPDSNS